MNFNLLTIDQVVLYDNLALNWRKAIQWPSYTQAHQQI